MLLFVLDCNVNKVLSFSVLSVKLASYAHVERSRNHREKPVVLTFQYKMVSNNHLRASKMVLFAILSYLLITTVPPLLSLTSADWLESQLAKLSTQSASHQDDETQWSNLIQNQQ
jgi:hypothetical protein